ncbi:hemin ABC transporter substrate-binding protein [Amorphus sp. 3PC139-8]|uniref:heme/hemin ABC transporter substrate-binding protein n=1 Tax=Amorphus sp. 3PC139-8 TaxID=2735676 RepID=UPI00345C9CB3
MFSFALNGLPDRAPERPLPASWPPFASRWALAALVSLLAAAAPAKAEEIMALPSCGADDTLDRSRIVAIGGTITEILYDLGLEDDIVAVDTTSQFPPRALEDKPDIGYMRALSAEGVLSMSPSLLLVSEGSGPPEVLDVLEKSSVPLLYISEEPSADGVLERIRSLGAAMCAQEKAETLAEEVAEGFQELDALRAEIETPKRVLFVMSMQHGRPLVAGSETAADAIIALAGAKNAADGLTGYKPMSEEAVVAAAPDAVLMMNRGNHQVSDILSTPAFRLTPAGRDGELITMDGQFLLGFGPRTPDAASTLARMLYPELGGEEAAQ